MQKTVRFVAFSYFFAVLHLRVKSRGARFSNFLASIFNLSSCEALVRFIAVPCTDNFGRCCIVLSKIHKNGTFYPSSSVFRHVKTY